MSTQKVFSREERAALLPFLQTHFIRSGWEIPNPNSKTTLVSCTDMYDTKEKADKLVAQLNAKITADIPGKPQFTSEEQNNHWRVAISSQHLDAIFNSGKYASTPVPIPTATNTHHSSSAPTDIAKYTRSIGRSPSSISPGSTSLLASRTTDLATQFYDYNRLSNKVGSSHAELVEGIGKILSSNTIQISKSRRSFQDINNLLIGNR